MASKIKKSFGASIQGVLDIQEFGNIIIDVEDYGEVALSDFIKEFKGKDCKITVVFATSDT